MRETVNDYKEILNKIPEAIILVNDNCVIEYVNSLGIEVLSIINGNNQTDSKLILPDVIKEKVKTYLSKEIKERKRENIYKIYIGDNHFELMINETYESKKLILYIKDISEKERIKNNLEELEERIGVILENMPIMFDALDESGNIIYWNKECELVTGYSYDEIINNPKAMEILYPDEEYRKNMDKQINKYNGYFRDVEWRITCKDGSKRTISWFDVSSRIKMPNWPKWAFGVDITKRKNIEKKLMYKTQELQSIVEALPDLIFRLDRDGVVIDYYAGKPKQLLILPIKFVGKKAVEVLPFPINKKCQNAIDKVNSTNRMVRIEHNVKSENQINYYEGRFVPLSKGEMLVILRDITSNKYIEKEIVKNEKLKAITALVGGLAHDFNNILTVILGNVSLLSFNENIDEEAIKKLNNIEKATLKGKDLASRLLTFAKGKPSQKKFIDIKNILEDITMMSLIGSNVVSEFNFQADLWIINGDEDQLSQVISNIVINAKEAMTKGGELIVSGKNVYIDEEFEVGYKKGNYVEICFKDNGCGIEKNNLNKIFNLYFTTKKNGTGLGIPSIYTIVTNHNGYVKVESEKGKGTEFYIYLPAVNKEILDKISDNIVHPQERLIKGKGKILIMDDEKQLRKVISMMLNHIGYETIEVSEGKEAIRYYKEATENNEIIDIILLDLTVPGGMGGIETIKELKKINPKVKVILSSGYGGNEFFRHYKKYGFRGAINKPFTIEKLSEVINNVKK